MTTFPLGETRDDWRAQAREAGIPVRDIDLLIAFALGQSPTWVFAHDDYEMSQDELAHARAVVQRRFSGEPVQYIRGITEFYGREFETDERVLIPRPETEIVVEQVLQRTAAPQRILDICTGSGAIATTLALETSAGYVAASDLSIEAVVLAHRNARRLGANVDFIACDLLDGLTGTFDVITANPPYIPGHEIPGLQREVRDFEPRVALTPGSSGTEIIDRMLHDAIERLAPDGLFVFEIGWKQSDEVAAMSRRHGWTVEHIEPDLVGIPRIVVLKR